MSKPERKLKVAVNPELIDKNKAGHASLFATGWINVELTPDELAEAIQCGIEYDPDPRYDAGSPEKVDPATVERLLTLKDVIF